ncbi:translation elongation factor Ts [Vallitalea okinawensis]|uniref:translation elongation factor Ts n=1 Tax=Vallitalea okinawensis TaxID=2078660 RepID=UPI000CFC3EF9|nr:translation elongation factor Ts [Vallitalea okinawensis]
MAITASMVKELREKTGAGMMDCKKALNETNGDIEKAVEFLREKGLAAAAKKAGRVAAEGLVKTVVSDDHKVGAIVEVNSETDFVAKNEDFQVYVKEVAEQALNTKAANIDEFLSEAWSAEASKTVKDVLVEKVAKIGENLSIRRFEKIDNNTVVVDYIHGGGRIGVLVELECSEPNAAIFEMGKNVAMQVAAINPKYLSREQVSKEYIEKETEILKQQALNEGKPEAIVEKMVVGRLNKQLKEVCLLDQAYVKDGDLTVAKYIANTAKEAGVEVTLKNFVRFETGEGIEKKEENFAEEVARQIGQ